MLNKIRILALLILVLNVSISGELEDLVKNYKVSTKYGSKKCEFKGEFIEKNEFGGTTEYKLRSMLDRKENKYIIKMEREGTMSIEAELLKRRFCYKNDSVKWIEFYYKLEDIFIYKNVETADKSSLYAEIGKLKIFCESKIRICRIYKNGKKIKQREYNAKEWSVDDEMQALDFLYQGNTNDLTIELTGENLERILGDTKKNKWKTRNTHYNFEWDENLAFRSSYAVNEMIQKFNLDNPGANLRLTRDRVIGGMNVK